MPNNERWHGGFPHPLPALFTGYSPLAFVLVAFLLISAVSRSNALRCTDAYNVILREYGYNNLEQELSAPQEIVAPTRVIYNLRCSKICTINIFSTSLFAKMYISMFFFSYKTLGSFIFLPSKHQMQIVLREVMELETHRTTNYVS